MRIGRLTPPLAAVAAGIALAFAGCGGDEPDAPAEGPATVAPAETFVYLEATIRTDGPGAENLARIASHFPGGERLDGLIETALDDALARDASGLTYAEDIEPWLGERAALAFTDLAAFLADDEDPPFAAIVEITDREAARETLERSVEGARSAEYGDAELIRGDDVVIGFLDEFIVAAEEEATVEEMVDAATGETGGLADAEGFTYEVGDVDGSEALGFGWIDQGRLIEAAVAEAGESDGISAEQGEEVFDEAGFALDRPTTLAVTGESDSVRLDLAAGADDDAELIGNAGALIAALPADTAVAAGCPGCLDAALGLFRIGFEQSAAEDGVSAEEADEVFERTFGAGFDRLEEVIDDVVLFARPGGPLGLEGGALASVADRAAAEDLLAALRLVLDAQAGNTEDLERLPDGAQGFSLTTDELPAPLSVVLDGDRLAVGLGEETAAELVAPAETLGETGRLDELDEQLSGDLEPFIYAEVARVLQAIGPLTRNDANFAEALPYLRVLDRLAGGASDGGGELRLRSVVTLGE